MDGYAGALDTIDKALAQYEDAPDASSSPVPAAPPASGRQAPQVGTYSVTMDDAPPTPGVRFATPKDAPAYQRGLDAIDAALAAGPSTDDRQSTASADASTPAPSPASAKPKFSDIPADVATQIVAGTDKGALSLAGLPGDVQRTSNSLWDRAALGAVHKGFDWTGYGPQAGTPERDEFDRGWNAMNDVGGAVAGPQNIPTGADLTRGFEAVGGKLPDPRTVPGEYARTLGEFVPGAGRNLVTGALLPAVASEAAGQATKGTGLEPYARVVAGIVGAGAGMVVPHTLKPVTSYVEPFTKGGQDAIAARTLGKETADLPAARAALDQPSEIIPGSMPTTFQQTGDVGLGQLERKQRMNAITAPAYIERDQAQNAARVGALQDIQQSGSPADVAAQFRQLREGADRQAQAQIDAATPAAQDANAAVGGHGTADSTGYALRQPMADARGAAKENEDQLWSLVNQDAGVPTVGLAQAAQEISKGVSRSATPLSGEEARILGVAAGYPAVQRFGELKDLRSSITDATAEARQAVKTQSVRRLTMLREALDDALDHGVENQVALEDVAVRRGAMRPEDTMKARMRTHWALDGEVSGQRQRLDAATGTGGAGVGFGGSQSRRSSGPAGNSGTSGTRGSGLQPSPGSPGVPQEASAFGPADIRAHLARKAAVGSAPQSLVGFLRARGGLREFGGELKARDLNRTFPGLVNNRTGMSLDHAREAAAEAGYLGPDTTHAVANTDVNDFLHAIDNHPVYSIHDQDRVIARGARQQLRDLQGQYKQAAEDIENSFVEHGGDLPSLGKELLHDASTIMVHDRIPWDQALERARQNEIGNLLDGANVEQSATRQTEYRNELSSAPVFRPEDIKNYLAAKKATRTRAETFDEGVAGKVLQRAGRGGYEMPDAAVPAAIVPSGKATDALAVRQYLAAGGTPEALADASAYSLRSKALRPDGTLDPNKVHTWLHQNAEAVAEMPPEVAAKFRNVADAQSAVDAMVAKREVDTAAFNKTAIARVAGLQQGEDVVKTIGGIFGQNNAVAQMKSLSAAAASDPAARDGLRRAIVEHMLGQLMSNVSNNASGISQIKGDTFLGFMRKNGAALRQVFEPKELDTMAAVGRDIDRAMRTHQTKGLTSSPGTAQDIGAAKGSILSGLTAELGPAGFAMVSHAAGANVLTSGLSFLGAKTIGRMRAAGIANANDLVVKAMLDPALAKKLLAKVPDAPDRGTAQALGDQFVRLSRATAAGLYGSMPEHRSRTMH